MNSFVKLSIIVFFCLPLTVYATSMPSKAGEPSAHAAPAAEHSAPKGPLPPPPTPAPDNINTFLHTQLIHLTKAAPPRIQDRKLILTYQGDTQPRYVAAAFQFEAFRQKHLYFRNQNNIYFLVMDLPQESPSSLDYRLIVDGLWQSDPSNPTNIRNDQGIVLSRVSFSESDRPHLSSPEQKLGGEVEFRFAGRPGLTISVIGNFNQWDPYANYLEEEHPGQYSLRIALPPGTIVYQYVIGTRTLLDPLNARTARDDSGAVYSAFENRLVSRPSHLEASLPATEASAHHE